MRKSGWAAAAGFGSLLLLLTACGGSSSTPGSGSTQTSTSTAQPGGQPSSIALAPPGSQVIIVQKSALGWVLALANGQVVYTYGKDTKGGTPTCTGSCASIWTPVTGNPVASAGTTHLGTLGTVADANAPVHQRQRHGRDVARDQDVR